MLNPLAILSTSLGLSLSLQLSMIYDHLMPQTVPNSDFPLSFFMILCFSFKFFYPGKIDVNRYGNEIFEGIS